MKYLSFIILGIIALFLLAGCTANKQVVDNEPQKVARAYFESWNDKDYRQMYNLISDGFKSLEPTANTFKNFKQYAEQQKIEKVSINFIKQNSNNGKSSVVDYDVVFFIGGKDFPFSGAFTLRYKSEDDVPGWKLIHPYGENIDLSD